MSTRATIHFQKDNSTKAIIYRFWDGYPDGLGHDLSLFIADQKRKRDNRFNDPWALAALYIVWHYQAHDEIDGLAVKMSDPGDIEYRYRIACEDCNVPEIHVEHLLQ